MKSALKFVLPFTLMFVSTATLANHNQIAIAKKAILKGEVMPYATPELKQILQKAHKIDDTIREQYDEPYGCEFAEHFYLGHGNGGLEAQDIQNWNATTLQNGVIHITFSNGGVNQNLIEFTMKGNLIDNVKFGYSDNPKKIPNKTDISLKVQAQKMIKTNNCGF